MTNCPHDAQLNKHTLFGAQRNKRNPCTLTPVQILTLRPAFEWREGGGGVGTREGGGGVLRSKPLCTKKKAAYHNAPSAERQQPEKNS